MGGSQTNYRVGDAKSAIEKFILSAITKRRNYNFIFRCIFDTLAQMGIFP